VPAAVASVEAYDNGYRLSWPDGSAEAGQVVVATPAHAAGSLVRRLAPELSELLAQVRYHSSITVALGYDRTGFRHPLHGFGFLVPRVERRLLTACTWVGTKFPPAWTRAASRCCLAFALNR
jgi:oxygen-dependent protoporphyrinogen oxidase